MTDPEVNPFPTLRLDGPLPVGRFAIEASAGTGKTYSLTALTARHVAEEGLRPDQLLMVTFTRAAARDLRHRTRLQVRAAWRELQSVATGAPQGDTDDLEPWIRSIITGDAVEDRRRIARLENFLASFDDATITTIHGFFQIVLHRVGLSGPLHRDVTLVEDTRDLVHQVVADLVVGALAVDPFLFGTSQEGEPLAISTVLTRLNKAVTAVLGNLDSVIRPDVRRAELEVPLADLAPEKRWAAVVARAVAKVHERLEQADLMGFDGLITAVRDLLIGSQGPSITRAMSEQFRVVMVDEFQDTDRVQWEVLSRLFGERTETRSGAPVSFGTVGDPKQAIYRFRGADIEAYRTAVRGLDAMTALDTNYRSNARLIEALNHLFAGAHFGAEDIGYRQVRHRRSPEREGVLGSAALEIRWLPYSPEAGSGHPSNLNKARKQELAAGTLDVWNFNKDPSLEAVYADVANEIIDLINDGMVVDESGDERRIRPKDIAVLLPTNLLADRIHEVLRSAGIPAVRFRTQSVFASRAAQDWQILVDALCQPTSPSLVRACMVSVFGQWTLEDLARLDEEVVALAVGHWQQLCASWAKRLQYDGVAGLYHHVRSYLGFEVELVHQRGGERLLTDLDHIAEVLAGSPGLERGATAADARRVLLALRRDKADIEEYQRRIESDEEAVQIATIHYSKGLEFPIVFLPVMVKNNVGADAPLVYNVGEQRYVDVATNVAWSDDQECGTATERKERSKVADLGDDMRKLYVAATRAEQKLIIHWNPISGSFASALGRLLFGRDDAGRIIIDPESQAPTAKRVRSNAETARFLDFARASSAATHVVAIDPLTTVSRRLRVAVGEPAATSGARYTRSGAVERHGWGKWSYSRIVERFHAPEGDDASDEKGGMDEPRNQLDSGPEPSGFIGVPERETTSSAIIFPDRLSGPRFGSLVHALFEELDPHDSDFRAGVARRLEKHRRSIPDEVAPELVAALDLAIGTPLGSFFGGRALRNIARGDRLAEMKFELRLERERGIGLDEIGRSMVELLAPTDPFVAYGRKLAESSIGLKIAGSLYGEIDALFRVSAAENGADPAMHRYLVVDYKTNKVHTSEDVDPLAAYHPDRLVAEMVANDYVVQALLYSVAVHRYLRLRLPDYRPEQHLGGVAYLFVRGMTGPSVSRTATGEPYGVLSWRPSTELIAALDERFSEQGRP